MAVWLFQRAVWLDMVSIQLGIWLSFATASAYSYAVEGRQKRYIQGAFGRYLAPEIVRQIADARADERKKALQETAMGERGQMPTSEGGPEMGHFEAKIRGLGVVKDKSPVPEGAELGRNQISAAMARAGDRAEIEGRVA